MSTGSATPPGNQTPPTAQQAVRVRVQNVDERISLLEAQATAKEVASKYLGKHAIPWIVLLVALGVGSSYFLTPASLPAVIGLVSTSVMALIAMLTGITGTTAKEERPEFALMRELLLRLDQRLPPTPPEPMRVEVAEDKVTVMHGENVVHASRRPALPEGQSANEAPE